MTKTDDTQAIIKVKDPCADPKCVGHLVAVGRAPDTKLICSGCGKGPGR